MNDLQGLNCKDVSNIKQEEIKDIFELTLAPSFPGAPSVPFPPLSPCGQKDKLCFNHTEQNAIFTVQYFFYTTLCTTTVSYILT